MRLSDLTSRRAVQAALDEYTRLGQAEFLGRHGFRKASGYLVFDPATQTWADSKAIAGVALGYQFPGSGGLRAEEFSGGAATVQERLRALGFDVRKLGDIAGQDWTDSEVELIVADYLAMLTLELTGQRYNKAERRRQLVQSLVGRTEGSIEFKHMNISAVMLELGFPYLKGYQPRYNFQRRLLDEVARQIGQLHVLEEAAAASVQMPAVETERGSDFGRVLVEAPRREHKVREAQARYDARPTYKRDYLERETHNRTLGLAGEEFVMRFEQWRLAEAGCGQLAERVKHTSKIDGDGAGYDIRSFEADGRDRFIEVKTTRFGDRTPFFVSSNELAFGRAHSESFQLYRLFDFRAFPRMFHLAGAIDQHCDLDPVTFRASFA